MKVKFTFILKSGKVFECVEDLTTEQFEIAKTRIKIAFANDSKGYLNFDDCMVKLSECAVADWEVLNG